MSTESVRRASDQPCESDEPRVQGGALAKRRSSPGEGTSRGSAQRYDEPGESLQDCMRGLFERRDPRVRLRTTLKLRRHRSRAVLPAVIEQLDTEIDPAVTAGLILVVAAHGGVEQVPLVSTFLSHRDHRVVQAAVLALYRVGGEDALPLLVALLSREDPRVLRQALAALVRTDPAMLRTRLELLLGAPRETARAAGAACLTVLVQEETARLAGDGAAIETLLAGLTGRSSREPDGAGPSMAQLPAESATPHRASRFAMRRVVNRFHESGWRAIAAGALVCAMLAVSWPGGSDVPSGDTARGEPARERAAVVPAPLPPLPALEAAPVGVQDTALLLRRAEILRSASLAHRPARPVATPAQRREWALQTLAQTGIKNPRYLDLRAREAATDPDRQRLFMQVRARQAAGDTARALALVRDALAAAEAADLTLIVALRAKERELALALHDTEGARAARVAELTAEAGIQAILEATLSREGRPLAAAGSAREVLRIRDAIAAMSASEFARRAGPLTNAECIEILRNDLTARGL